MKAEGNRWGQRPSSKCVWHLLCAGRCPGTLSWDVGLGGLVAGLSWAVLCAALTCWVGGWRRGQAGRAWRKAPEAQAAECHLLEMGPRGSGEV